MTRLQTNNSRQHLPPLILSVIYFSLFSCISKRLSILLRNILFTLNKQL
ncbi:hypothetical protein HMPREF2531_03015 [Bacteroides intestinalis]|uniref:Uncharacterized protein n=1 Tax=Bacteroides intestinalis TaxID=329854 RepID=A0A139L7B4_9BACE|nr:hypothetical protein HMPREF2531_03015 [Bacteroides intestinalis]